MSRTWAIVMFVGIAMVGATVIALTLHYGAIRICGRSSGCVSYSFDSAPGTYLLALAPAVLMLVAGLAGAFWAGGARR